MAQINYSDTNPFSAPDTGYQNQPWYQTAQTQAAANASPSLFGPSTSTFGGGRGSFLSGSNATTTPVTAPAAANITPARSATATVPTAPAFSPAYNTSVANQGYNPYQYATTPTAQSLANMFGGTVTQTSGLGGPNAPPPQNQVSIPGMNDPSNAGILSQEVSQFGQPWTRALLNAQNSYNGLNQAQEQTAYSNAYYSGLPRVDNSNIVQGTLRYAGGNPVGYGGTLYRDPATGQYYNANTVAGGGYSYDPKNPLPASMFAPGNGGTYITGVTAPGVQGTPQTPSLPGLGYTPNTNVGGGVTPQNDTVQQLLPAIQRYFNNALGTQPAAQPGNSLTSLLSLLFGVPLDNFMYNGQPRYSLFY